MHVSEDVREINVSDLNMENIYEPDRIETDLLVGAALGPTEDLKRYINLIGGEVNGITRLGQTALSGAIFSHSFDKKEEGAKVLIELGADVNAVVAGGQSIIQRVLYFYDQQTESFDDGGRSKRMAEKRIRFLLLNGTDVSEHQAQQVIGILGRQEFQELAKSRKLKVSTLNNCYSVVSKIGS